MCGMPIDGDGWGFPRCCDECQHEEQLKTGELQKER
jgi:hypothetical protein